MIPKPTLAKSAVRYRPCQYASKCCGGCRHYVPWLTSPATSAGFCQIVKGIIGRDMTCDRFTAKVGEAS